MEGKFILRPTLSFFGEQSPPRLRHVLRTRRKFKFFPSSGEKKSSFSSIYRAPFLASFACRLNAVVARVQRWHGDACARKPASPPPHLALKAYLCRVSRIHTGGANEKRVERASPLKVVGRWVVDSRRRFAFPRASQALSGRFQRRS